MNDDFDDEDIEWDETEPNGAEADDVDEDDGDSPIEAMVHDGMNVVEFDFDDEDDADEDDELASTLND
jgi:hypothetical protein